MGCWTPGLHFCNGKSFLTFLFPLTGKLQVTETKNTGERKGSCELIQGTPCPFFSGVGKPFPLPSSNYHSLTTFSDLMMEQTKKTSHDHWSIQPLLPNQNPVPPSYIALMAWLPVSSCNSSFQDPDLETWAQGSIPRQVQVRW